MLITRNPHLLPPKKRPSNAVVALPASADAPVLEQILADALKPPRASWNWLQRFVEDNGHTTLSNKVAVAACVDPEVGKALGLGKIKLDNTPDVLGVTPAMMFARYAKSPAMIVRSLEWGVEYDLDSKDVHTRSLASYAGINRHKKNQLMNPVQAVIAEAGVDLKARRALAEHVAVEKLAKSAPRRTTTQANLQGQLGL